MTDGVLGREEEEGKYVDNIIPGAKSPSPAFDDKYYTIKCFPFGTPKISGPNGFVTYFVHDGTLPVTDTVPETPVVKVEGDTICVIIPQVQVTTLTGTMIIFEWFDVSCLLDSTTLLKEKGRVKKTVTRKTPAGFLRYCETDYKALIFHKILGLLGSGLSPSDIVKEISKLVAFAPTSPEVGGAVVASRKEEHKLIIEPKKKKSPDKG